MGKTKRPSSAAPRQKQAQTTASPHQSTVADSSSDIIKSACEQALRDKYLNNAADSAKKTLSLFPNSITLNYLNARIFIKFAKYSSDYQRIFDHCWKALKALPSGLGPGEDIIASQPEMGGKSQESRILRLKQVLLDVMDRSSIESLLIGKNVREKMKENACLRIKVRVPIDEELPRKFERNEKRNFIKNEINIFRDCEKKVCAGFVIKRPQSILDKVKADASKITIVSNYWKEVSSEERRGLLQVSIDEIAGYYKKHDRLVADCFLEAVDFARKTNKWKCLRCFSCASLFFDWKDLRSHVFLKHLGGLSEHQMELVPFGLEDSYVEEIENGVWKPVDVDNMAQELSTFKRCKSVAYQEKCKIYSDQKKWMFCDDAERQELLKKIHRLLKLFLKNQCLAPRILSWMWDYTIQELEESIQLGFKDLIPILEQTQTPLSICFLWLEQLEVVFDFLEELSKDCDLEDNISDDGGGSKDEFCDYEPIYFNSDSSCLVLDKKFIRSMLDPGEHINIVADEGAEVIPFAENPEKDIQFDRKRFVNWLFASDKIRELLNSWINLRKLDKELAGLVFQFVETDFSSLKYFCERKCRLLEYQETFTDVENICLGEHKRREEIPEYKEQNFASLLLERQDELVDAQSDIIGNEHACLLNVLRFAQYIARKKFGLDETLISTCTQFPDLECHEDKANRDILLDVCVKEAIKMEKQNVVREVDLQFCKLDVLIMKNVASIKRMELKFVLVSALDYQFILFYMVKSFIRAYLEDRANKDFVKKANAADILVAMADLAPEPSKSMIKGSDDLRKTRKKSKLKRHKNQGKAMVEGAGGSQEHLPLDKENAEKDCHSIASDGGYSDFGIVVSTSTEDLKQMEEEHRSKIGSKVPQKLFLKEEESGKSPSGSGMFGVGLKNYIGENNCFLNVIIQCLWNIQLVRNELCSITDSGHEHIGDPCVVCELAQVFGELSEASTRTRRETVSTTSLRLAISKCSPHRDSFQEGQMNDADEVLQNIFIILHQSLTSCPTPDASSEPEKSKRVDRQQCTSNKCLAHRVFGMDIYGYCDSCGLQWRHQTFSDFSHYIRSSQLREKKNKNQASSFDELMKLLLMDDRSTCNRDVGGCGKPNRIQFILRTPPQVFVCVLSMQTAQESREDIRDTLTALDTEVDIGDVYLGLGPGNGYCLASMVCYGELHYVSFCYSCEGKRWTMYDDAHVEVIGFWHNLLDKCVDKLLQPQILFFEACIIKSPQFDDLRKLGRSSGMQCNLGVGEAKQAEDIPEETLYNDWQTAKDEGGNLQSHVQNEMKFSRQDKSQDAFRVQKHVPLQMDQKLLKEEETGKCHCMVDYMYESEILGSELKDDLGKNYSSLNVVIQSLWHIPQFRNELACKTAPEHKHIGDPCVVCGLAERFVELSAAHINPSREIDYPTSLSTAIDKLSPCGDLFQKDKMSNAFEVLRIILESLHHSLTSVEDFCLSESKRRNCVGSLECTTDTCLIHTLFGMTVFKSVNDDNCGLESRQQKHTFFFHTISAFELRKKVSNLIRQGSSSFDELLKLVLVDYHLPWKPDADGCGEKHIKYFLQTPSHVFTSVLEWTTIWASREDIRETLAALATEIDVGILYQGLEKGKKYHMVSVVCYRGLLYSCFIYSDEYKRWMLYDDTHVEVIGCWDCLCKICVERHFQPRILFFVESAPTEIDQNLPRKSFFEEEESGKSESGSKDNYEDSSGIFGVGLKNDIGENNCFLNAIIQCLWNVQLVRNELCSITDSGHEHIGDPCVVCELADVFGELSEASTRTRRETVSTTSLRLAISKCSPHRDRFQEGQMNDADEVLQNIFIILHQSLTSCPTPDASSEPEKSKRVDSQQCTSNKCLAHRVFGMDIHGYCDSCGLQWRHRTFSDFSHYIHSSQLREEKNKNKSSSFDELMKLMLMEDRSTCNPDVGGCGKPNRIQFILRTPPHVFTCVLVRTAHESREDTRKTLTALGTELDLGVVYQGLGPGKKYCLVSMVCYRCQHYVCFSYSHEHKRWTMFNDANVEVVGCWDDLLSRCSHEQFQPQILCFEAVQ
ncbi:UBIQUITIN SPECIFIC PROTEINASE [Salix purpurea]|uniref:UBIQUITIN SPECIFIC PROTEINASE n=1 Tax=Salix purpurea TaxID=77065 RepID=A0A9Q0URE1_SALPP|nr:UBIQUITIN SPECIFIC PROTEINASE [Salix purpurea]